jgi:hypothetical protein
MRYALLDRYVIEQEDDRVQWIRIFSEEMKIMAGRGVYRDDVLVCLYPQDVSDILNLAEVRKELAIESLPEWNKTRYLLHMGNVHQDYQVFDAIRCDTGELLQDDELVMVATRVNQIF